MLAEVAYKPVFNAGFQRGAIKPRVVPFQISLQAVG